MNHEQLKDDVMAFSDGELRGERRSAAAAHLEICSDCRESVAAWRASAAWLKSARPAPSEAFVTAVMSRVERSETRGAGRFADWLARWMLPVAAAAAFAGFSALVVYPASETPTSTEAVLYSEVEDQLPATWLMPAGGTQERDNDVFSEEI